MKTVLSFFDFFLDLVYTFWVKGGKKYFKILFALAVILFATIILPLLVGIMTEQAWLVSAIGLLWGFMALLFLILTAPFAIINRKIIIFTSSILLFGMFFALIASFVPWRENPKNVIPMLLAASILAAAGAFWGNAGILGRKIVIFATSIMLIALITSFFLPMTFSEIGPALKKADQNLRNNLKFGTDIPICAETEQTHIINESLKKIELPIYPDCRSGWVEIQTSKKTNFRFYKKPENGFLEVYFLNGSTRIIHKNERVWFGDIPRLTFRLRGTKGSVVIEIQ